jgi:hypothetical protein
VDWKKTMGSASMTIQCGESIKLKWTNDFSGIVQMTRGAPPGQL